MPAAPGGILRIAGRPVAADGLLDTLGRLASRWDDLAAGLPGHRTPLTLLQALAGGPDEALTRAFEAGGAADLLARLMEHAGPLQERLTRLPGAVSMLLQPIGSFDERRDGRDSSLFAWPVIGAKTAAALQEASGQPYTLSLDAGAAIFVEPGDRWPYSDAMPERLLRLGMAGQVRASGSGRLPFGTGAVDISSNVGRNCALSYYFAPDGGDTPLALALTTRLATLADPFDFDAIWDAFGSSDLVGIHYQFEGSASIGVGVSLANQAVSGVAEIQAGATLKASFSLAGNFFLTLRAEPGSDGEAPHFVACLSRQRSKGASLGLDLGVTIDPAGLTSAVHALLMAELGSWDDALGWIKPFLSPGSWLQKHAGEVVASAADELIGDTAIRLALIRDLQGALGIGDIDRSSLVAWLADQLSVALEHGTGWANDPAGAAATVLDQLGRSLPALAESEIRDKVRPVAADLVGRVAEAFAGAVATALELDERALSAALHRLGVASTDSGRSLNGAMGGARQLVQRYDELFRKLLAATEKAATAKISAAVQIEERRQTGAVTEIEGTFIGRTMETRKAFEALTRGELASLVELIDDGGNAGFFVNVAKSRLKRYARSAGSFGLDLVLFGFGLTGSDLLSAEAEVIVDGAGNVQVDARASLRRRFKGLDAERDIELISAFSLVRSRALAHAPPGADRAIGLAVSIGHVDQQLERREVERFVGSLVEAGLMLPDALTMAAEALTRWAGNPGVRGKVAAALRLKLALDRSSSARLLGLDVNGASPGLSPAARRRVMATAVNQLQANGAVDPKAFSSSLAKVAERHPDQPREDLLLDVRRIRRALETERSGSRIPGIAAEDRAFVDAVELGLGLSSMIQQLRQVYFSRPETRPDGDADTWGPADYRDAERRAVRDARGWLQLNDVLFWTNSKVHARTIAFLETLAELAGVDPLTALSLTMTCTSAGGGVETIVLASASR